MTHPLRTLARDLMALGQENSNWSQVSGQFSHLSDYCQLVAGMSEALERETRLRAALEPFARNVTATSLSKALAHITREDLLRARAAFIKT